MIRELIERFEALEDPRCDWRIEHKLIDILVIAVSAVIAEADSFEDIALYGRCKRAWLSQFLALPNGIPSHDTFRRVFMLIDPDAFERCFLDWVRAVFARGGRETIAIDGKSVRRSFDRERGRGPLHLVSAWASERGLVLAQRAAPDEGSELDALPELLDGLDLAGCLVTLDALACNKGIARRILDRGADYLLTLKGNQRRAHAEVRGWFEANAFARDAPLRPCLDAFDDGHGRLVRRRVFACRETEEFESLRDWPGLRTVLAVETIRSRNSERMVTAETRYFLASAGADPVTLARAIRDHWTIENRLHWVLDVGFREDLSRVRERRAARNLALLRRLALNLARADASLKASLKGKRKYAAWDDGFMECLIRG